MRIQICEEAQGMPLSELVVADRCPCGELVLYTRLKDAEFTKLAEACSPTCKEIAEVRKAWEIEYAYSVKEMEG
jgi:hypothetical protein